TNTRGEYTIFEIEQNADFKAEINNLRQKNIKGFNVTIPYKETIINELNDIDEQARNIGAVNKVLNLDGKLIGYNKNGLGYVKNLEKSYSSVNLVVLNIYIL